MKNRFVVVGLGFGDEGKGGIVDHLCLEYGIRNVIRFNGGAQCGHNVVLEDGRHHTFSQFGSGTFRGARTFMTEDVLVNPIFFQSEATHLAEKGVQGALSRVAIDARALVTNPFQVSANRIRELQRSSNRHGSCGMGIGETMQDATRDPDSALRVGDLSDSTKVRRKLQWSKELKLEEVFQRPWGVTNEAILKELSMFDDPMLIDYCVEAYRDFAREVEIVGSDYLPALIKTQDVVFEGAQGTLLDADRGFFPYVTYADTTSNKPTLLVEQLTGSYPRCIGVLRAYGTRHGAGPFPTEDASLGLWEAHNGFGPWQREFRLGHFDLPLAKHAVKLNPYLTELAVTCLDQVDLDQFKICTGYEGLTDQQFFQKQPHAERTSTAMSVKPVYRNVETLDLFLYTLARELGRAPTIQSFGPTAADKDSDLCLTN